MTVTVAIVGRPNVGKSTLFNRLVGRKIALVDDTPGVTRDRREAEGRIADLRFRILDTAGYEDVKDGSLEDRMRQQTEMAIREADVILFMIDARAGVTPLDQRFGQVLRKAGKQVHLVGNKAESSSAEAGLVEAFKLGFGEPSRSPPNMASGSPSSIPSSLPPSTRPNWPRPSAPPPKRPRAISINCPKSMSTSPPTCSRARATRRRCAGTRAATSTSPSSAAPMPASRPW